MATWIAFLMLFYSQCGCFLRWELISNHSLTRDLEVLKKSNLLSMQYRTFSKKFVLVKTRLAGKPRSKFLIQMLSEENCSRYTIWTRNSSWTRQQMQLKFLTLYWRVCTHGFRIQPHPSISKEVSKQTSMVSLLSQNWLPSAAIPGTPSLASCTTSTS